MSSFINTTVTAIMAALQSAPAVAAQVGRVRLRPLAQSATQAVVVRPLHTQVTEAGLMPGMPISWTSTIAVECYARSGATLAPDVAVDPLIAAVYARLMTDPTLGGVVLGIQPQEISYDFDADIDQTTCVTLSFSTRHRANGATLS